MNDEIKKILTKDNFDKEDIISLLSIDDDKGLAVLKESAYNIMKHHCGEKVYLRGLIEFSNICKNDCYYCGIRKSNSNVVRYTLDKEEVLDAALWCAEQGYGSVVLQSGERSDQKFINYLEELIQLIKSKSISSALPQGLGITLCVGEQTKETYQRFFSAGAHRYLLRIETSNPVLYAKLHPENLDWQKRVDCLYDLKEVGFQVGTGVMIGFPGQTIEDLANDILFFKEMDIDMIGMGPYLVHNQTPFYTFADEYSAKKQEIYKLALKMIAVTRIVLKDVNIASTTALQAMYPFGRENGLMFGANVIMPLLTPTQYREQYQLYEGKPCLDEFSSDCLECVQRRIESTGRTVAFNEYGDSKHFKGKTI